MCILGVRAGTELDLLVRTLERYVEPREEGVDIYV